MRKAKRWTAYGLIFTILISIFTIATPQKSFAQVDLNLNAEAAILVDANTGRILYQLEPDLTLPPASMTKMMTEYLVLEAIHEGKTSWDQTIQISDFVYQISQNRSLSNVPLRKDTQYTVRELYEAMAIYSANGATIALAEHIAGTETEFVKMMNEKGAELNLGNFKFVNSSGLNNKDLLGNHPEGTGANEENMLSAKATARLAYHLIKDYPEVLETASIPKKIFREGTSDAITMLNWNWMLPGAEGYLQAYSYNGLDGLKTGSTELAGYCFTATAVNNNGMRLISVVMKTDSQTARFEETKKLLDYGFQNYVTKEIFPAGYQNDEFPTVAVVKGKEKEVEVATNKALTMTIKAGEEELYEPLFEIDPSALNEDEALVAPAEKNEVVGKMTVTYTGDESIEYLFDDQQPAVEVVTTANVEKANFIVLMFRGIGGFFSDIWVSAANAVKGIFS